VFYSFASNVDCAIFSGMSDPDTSLTPDAVVSLREVTGDTVRHIIRLKVKPDQTSFVADNATSIAQAHFEPKAWFRAIYADETPVGFVMLFDDPEGPEYYLWRLMIDGRYQHLGYGRRAMQQLIDYVRSRPNATELLTSYVPGEGSPEPFYTSLGFANTGEVDDGENVMRLVL
jgi:diamine N-acetyltransferase